MSDFRKYRKPAKEQKEIQLLEILAQGIPLEEKHFFYIRHIIEYIGKLYIRVMQVPKGNQKAIERLKEDTRFLECETAQQICKRELLLQKQGDQLKKNVFDSIKLPANPPHSLRQLAKICRQLAFITQQLAEIDPTDLSERLQKLSLFLYAAERTMRMQYQHPKQQKAKMNSLEKRE